VVKLLALRKLNGQRPTTPGMTVRYLLPRTGPQKSPLRPRCGLHPLDEGTATAYAAHHDEAATDYLKAFVAIDCVCLLFSARCQRARAIRSWRHHDTRF
jgi:hypothetical protein